MKYLSVRATKGLLTIDSIPFDTLEFTHDIDSMKDLCTSLIRFESTVDEWKVISKDAEYYLYTLRSQACSSNMIAALGDSLLDSLANFKAETIDGELIITVIERGTVICTLTEAGGVTHIDHMHVDANPRGRKRRLRDAFTGEPITLKMTWQPRVTDIDVLSQLARVHGINNLGSIVSTSNDVPGNTKISHFTLEADQNNDDYHGTYTVNIEWTGRRPHRPTTAPVKKDIDQLLSTDVRRELTVHPDSSPSAVELYADLLDSVDVELPRMPLFMPVAWPKDMRNSPTKVQLYVSPEDDTYSGATWVTINWRTPERQPVHTESRKHLSAVVNGVSFHTIKLQRLPSIKSHEVFDAVMSTVGELVPAVMLESAVWAVAPTDRFTNVEIIASPDDGNYYGGIRVEIKWI